MYYVRMKLQGLLILITYVLLKVSPPFPNKSDGRVFICVFYSCRGMFPRGKANKVLWGLLRIAYVHLQMRKFSIFYLQHDVIINNFFAWGIPIIFATIALASGQIGYVTSHYCGPTLNNGEALLWIPLLVYVGIASLLQIWTLLEIEEVLIPKSYL
jgi:hypothetical protein